MTYSIVVSIPGIKLPLLQVDPGPLNSQSVSDLNRVVTIVTYSNGKVVGKPRCSNSKVHVAPLTPVLCQSSFAVEDLKHAHISY